MVGIIFKAADNAEAPVLYNEKKNKTAAGARDDEGEGIEGCHLITTENIPDGSSLKEEFNKLIELNEKTRTRGRKLTSPGFHMVLSPSETDKTLPEKNWIELVKDIMDKLGYGTRPYAIYRHTDTEHPHTHVVSIRIDEDGKKIDDSFEEVRLQRILRELSLKYNFTIGREQETETEKESETNRRTKERKIEPVSADTETKEAEPFRKNRGIDTTKQIRNIFNSAMQWSFKTPTQFAMIMRHIYNVEVRDNGETFSFLGCDDKGNPSTSIVTQNELELDAARLIKERCAAKKNTAAIRKKLEGVVMKAARENKAKRDFDAVIKRYGYSNVIVKSQDGKPFGIIWLDRYNKTAINGSETDADLKWYLDLSNRNGWNNTQTTSGKDITSPKQHRKTPIAAEGNIRNTLAQRRQSLAEGRSSLITVSAAAHVSSDNSLTDDIYEDETKKIMSQTNILKQD